MKILISILFTLIFSLAASGQQAYNWKTLTDMKSVRSAVISSEGIWAATSGGAFHYNFSDGSFQTLTKSDGLNGSILTSVAADKYGKIWFGSSTGVIDVYNPVSSSFKTLLDIFNSDKTAKQINEIKAEGDTIIISTDFGISIIDAVNFVFYDTYFRFGTLSSNIKVNSSYKANLIYSCTDFGMAIQKAGAVNLSAPESWDVYTTDNGLPSNKVLKAVIYNGSPVVATDRGLATFDGLSWQPFINDFNNIPVVDLLVSGETLFIMSANNVYSYSNGVTINIYSSSQQLNRIDYSPGTGLYISSSGGVLNINNDEVTTIVPNGPQSSRFSELSVDKNGALWSASGRDVTGVGIYKLHDGFWTNYNISNVPSLPNNYYHTVYTAPDNTKYFGNWGTGFLRIRDEKFDVFTVQNTDMKGISNTPDFLVISHFGVDSRNNLWILNYGAVDRRTLSMLTPDSTWHHFTIPSEQNFSLEQHFYLAIDQYDTKWFASYDSRRMGLFYFNENKTYDNAGDDKSGYINRNNGLNENSVNAIVMDRRGDIWVGTTLGVNVISNTNLITTQTNPEFRISSVFSLRQQTINCIAVDPLNQKWVGTNQGLLLVNSDGSSLLASYDTRNSALLADEIRSISIDENSGLVYVGTDAGLSMFQTAAVKPVDTFSDLTIFPSPFLIKNSDNLLTIDGLIRDTDVKILSTSGKLIREFNSPGGRIANWDGRDNDGNLVSTGVYFIVAYDKEGNNVKSGKIAVLRE